MDKKDAAAGIILAILLASSECGKSEPPGVKPAGQEKSGKTWHIWNTGTHDGKGDALPMGAPELAWSFNCDGEAQQGLLEGRDKNQNLDSAAKRKERSELVKLAHPQQGVDAMQKEFPKAGPYPQGVSPLTGP